MFDSLHGCLSQGTGAMVLTVNCHVGSQLLPIEC